MIEKVSSVCKQCGNEFEHYPSEKKIYCSKVCYLKNKHKDNTKSVCNFCHKEFLYGDHKNRARIFCSHQCQHETSKKQIKNNCKNCDKEFERCFSQQSIFCSQNCRRYFSKAKIERTICKNCDQKFQHKKSIKRIFCSDRCATEKNNPKFWATATTEQKMERFLKYFKKYVVIKEGCWGWEGQSWGKGYGMIPLGERIAAHRFSYLYYKSAITENMCVCHTCDNRKCCNPEHLFLGTNKDNFDDMVAKGRYFLKTNGRPRAKLSDTDIIEIKKLLKNGVYQKEIAKQFNVSKSTIWAINTNKTYKNVQGSE